MKPLGQLAVEAQDLGLGLGVEVRHAAAPDSTRWPSRRGLLLGQPLLLHPLGELLGHLCLELCGIEQVALAQALDPAAVLGRLDA